jgi:hypothetical protein
MELTLDCQHRTDSASADYAVKVRLTFLDVGDCRVIGHVQVLAPHADLLLRLPCEYSIDDISVFVRDLEKLHATLTGKATLRTSTGALEFSALQGGRIGLEFTQDGLANIPNLIYFGDFTLSAHFGGLQTDQSYLPELVASLSALIRSIPPDTW